MSGVGCGQNHGPSLLSGPGNSVRVVSLGVSMSGWEKLGNREQPEVCSEEQLKATGLCY